MITERGDWTRDSKALERIRPKLDPDGSYLGRHLISHDTPIDKGVYVGGSAREAIVVDAGSPELRELYSRLLGRLAEINQKVANSGRSAPLQKMWLTMFSVYDAVEQAFKPGKDEADLNAVLDGQNLNGDAPVGLDFFIKERLGVCRHHSLTAAVLLENLVNDGHLKGQVSADRNMNSRGDSHAWARYASTTGSVWIVDASKHRWGPLGTIIRGQLETWPYARPEDEVHNSYGRKR